MKGFVVILTCLILVLLAAFHTQVLRHVEASSAWISATFFDDSCSKVDRLSRQACAEQHNRLAGKIDQRLDLTDQQKALDKALGN